MSLKKQFFLILFIVLILGLCTDTFAKKTKKPGPNYVWVPKHINSNGIIIPGHWRLKEKKGYVWIKSSNKNGVWVAGYWKPVKIQKNKIWVPGHVGINGKWVPGHYRTTYKTGHLWVSGYYNKNGVWIKGHWKKNNKKKRVIRRKVRRKKRRKY